MQTTLQETDRDALIARIQLLDETRTPVWGRMNLIQMIKHCILWEEMVLNNIPYQRVLIGRIFGKMGLRKVLKDEKPLKKSTPTIPQFIIREKTGDLEPEKQKWISLIKGYGNFENDQFIHPFFGKMTKEQIGKMAYKHIDHHLRQFGV